MLEFIEANGFNLEPAEFITDFEDGLRKAIKTVYSNVKLNGCWFHYVRAIQGRTSKLGMRKFLKKNRKGKKILKQLMSLPLLPPEMFDEGYQSIKNLTARSKLLKRFENLFAYFEGYWLNQVEFSFVVALSRLFIRSL